MTTGAELRALGVRFRTQGTTLHAHVPPEARAVFDAEVSHRIAIILAAAPSGPIPIVEINQRPAVVPRAGLCMTCFEPHPKSHYSGMCELCICSLRGALRRRKEGG